MIRHIVLLKFRAEATDTQRAHALAGLAELPSLIDSISALSEYLYVTQTYLIGLVVCCG